MRGQLSGKQGCIEITRFLTNFLLLKNGAKSEPEHRYGVRFQNTDFWVQGITFWIFINVYVIYLLQKIGQMRQCWSDGVRYRTGTNI
jgi:hypothetical protein